MNRDLFLALMALDSYNRGNDRSPKISRIGASSPGSDIGLRLGNAVITRDDLSSVASASGFYALAYGWNGEKIVSFRGADGLNEVTKGWTIGAGWTDQAQANLAVDFYHAATLH